MIFLLYASGQQVYASGQQGLVMLHMGISNEYATGPTRLLTESDGIFLISVWNHYISEMWIPTLWRP